MTDRAFDKWHKRHRSMDRDQARTAWNAGADEGLRSYFNLVGWWHTMHMEGGQTQETFSETSECPWGVRGVNFSSEYEVTRKPCYVRRP